MPGFIRENRKTNNRAHNDLRSRSIHRYQFCGVVPNETATFISPVETQTAVSSILEAGLVLSSIQGQIITALQQCDRKIIIRFN